MDKVVGDAATAVADIASGSSLAVGGFGGSGIPQTLIAALATSGASQLHVVSNNCGGDGWGLGLLVSSGQLKSATISYLGDNSLLAAKIASGEVDVEFIPQGTLAERLRAGGAGIPAFYTPSGVGTVVERGAALGRAVDAPSGEPREAREFDGRRFILERGLRCDFALVHAAVGDRMGNLRFRRAARNFNPLCAMAGRVAIAEVEELVEVGEIDPDDVHLPGVFVQRVVQGG